MSEYHVPVMLQECIDALSIRADGTYVDVTYGAGGHSKLILEKLGQKGRLFAFDQDDDALLNQTKDPRFTLIHANFKYLKKYLRVYGVEKVDGILADLGVSSHQLDVPERGFSYRFDAELDMRMSPHIPITAADVLASYSALDLQSIFSAYGEVRNAKTLAEEVVRVRGSKLISTTGDLNQILDRKCVGNRAKYFAQVYQALRMEVNREVEVLSEMLHGAKEVLRPGGRLVVMSYHSIEDKLVKNLLKTGNVDGAVKKDDFGHIERPFVLINKKVITANEAEVARNSRARSAKLRIGEKVNKDK